MLEDGPRTTEDVGRGFDKKSAEIREKLINNKYDKDGVSLADLEETADMLDSIQNA